MNKKTKYLTQIYLVTAMVGFFILAQLSYLRPYFQIDLLITLWIQQFHNKLFTDLMILISWPGFSPQILGIVIIIIGGLFLLRKKTAAMIACLNAASTMIVSTFIKTLVGRSRPPDDLVEVFDHLTDKSFPSGHVLFYTAFFGFISYITFQYCYKYWWGKLIFYILIWLILLIGISRIYLGQHWASDVLGGYLLGSILLIISIYLVQYYDSKTR